MGGISRLFKIVSGAVLAGGLFISSGISNKQYLNSPNINYQTETNSKDFYNRDYSNEINSQKDSIDIKNKIKRETKEKNLEEKLISLKYLDIYEKYPGHFKSLGLDVKKEREHITNSLEAFEKIYKNLQKKSLSEFTKEEVKNIFLKMDSCIAGGQIRIDLKSEEIAGQCLKYALIYHAIGEKYGFPIKLGLAPPIDEKYHVFVRWDSDGKHDPLNLENPINKGDFSWDNNSARAHKLKINYGETDKNFIDHFDISRKSIENKVYLKNFTENEILAFAYASRAFAYHKEAFLVVAYSEEEVKEKDSIRNSIFEKSIKLANKALQLDSLCILAYKTKAAVLGGHVWSLKKFGEAEKIINKSLELSLNQEDLIWTKADIYHAKGSDKAIELYKEGINTIDEKIKKEFLKEFPSYRKIYWLEKSKCPANVSLALIYSYIGEKAESEKWWAIEKEASAMLELWKNTANEQILKRRKEIEEGKIK